MSSSSRRLSAERSRLRMDSYSSNPGGRSRNSPPRRRELDNVMKKARKEGPDKSSYWNKKLLEVEEKDPNRWRHSGFKELYGGASGGGEGGGERSRSRSRSRSFRPRTPPPQRAASPWKSKSSRARSPKPRPKSPRPKSPPAKSKRPVTQPHRARSESLSSGSVSSCSDESCSVCSPKTKRRPPLPKEKERERERDKEKDREKEREHREREREREREKEKERVRERELREREKEREQRERERERERERDRAKVAESPRPALRSRSRSFSVPRSKPEKPRRKTKQRKRDKEKDKRSKSSSKQSSRRRRPTIKVESESDGGGQSSSPSPGPRLTLSERFGKMAQWSVDRDTEHHRNLRITAGDQLHVEMDSPPSPSCARSIASFPEGAWDDVRFRYTHYKEQGYLRDLTLQDYIKWEEWWYKYQDWLENERCYDRITEYWEKKFLSRDKRVYHMYRRRL